MRKLTAPLSLPDRHPPWTRSGIFSSVADENICRRGYGNPSPQRRKSASTVAPGFVAGDSGSRCARSGMTVWAMGGWLLLLILLFSQCARPFQPLALETRSYSQTAFAPANASESLRVTYDTFGILEVSNNRRYVKKAHKRNIKLLPMRLENTTSDTLTVNRSDLQVFGEYEAVTTPSLEKLRYVRQVSWPYLLFLLFDFTVSDEGGDVSVRLTYFPIGTTYGVSNFVVARVANRKFRQSMQQYATYPVAVPPGQMRYALLPVAADQPTNQLQIRYVASPR